MDEGIEKRIAAWDDEEWSLTRYSTPGRVKVFLGDLIAAYRAAMKGHKRLRRQRNVARAERTDARLEVRRLRAERDEALNRIDRCDHARATECPWERDGGQLKAENERLRRERNWALACEHAFAGVVERLQKENGLLSAAIVTPEVYVDIVSEAHERERGEALREVERLRAERDGWKNYNSATLEAWNVRVAAMERAAGEALRSLEGENEHLSATNECLWLAMDAARERQDKDKATIERLRAEVKRLRCVAMVRYVNRYHPVDGE